MIFVSEGKKPRFVRRWRSGQTMVVLPETFESKLPPEAKTLVPILKQYGYVLLATRPMITLPERTQGPVEAIPAH